MTYTDDARSLLRILRAARAELDKNEINVASLRTKVLALKSQIGKTESKFVKQIAPLLKAIGPSSNIVKGTFGGLRLAKMPRISDMDAKLAELQSRARNGLNKKAANNAKRAANNQAKKAAAKKVSNAAARNALRKNLNALEARVGNPNRGNTNVASARVSLRSNFDKLTSNQKAKALTNKNLQNAFNGSKPNSNFNKTRLNHIANVIRNATSRNNVTNFRNELLGK
jgi:hypothetical protein